MFFIDIAVPRDIDPRVNGLNNVYCYDIDDLRAVTDANKREREQEALKAQRIVEAEVAVFERWFESLSAVPTIKALRQRFHDVGESELERTMENLPHLSSKDAHQVRRLVHTVLNKLLHQPSQSLKQQAEEGNGKLYAEAVTNLFDLAAATAADDGKPAAADDPGESPATDSGGAKIVRLPLARSSKATR